MTTYIIYISKKKEVDENLIDDIEKRHKTEQNTVFRAYVDDDLPYGFVIEKVDDLPGNVAKRILENQKIDVDKSKVEKEIQRQKKILREDAKYSGDIAILNGEKGYKEKSK